MSNALMVGRDLIRAELPQYEPPPPFLPIEKRRGDKNYDNDLRMFLPRMIDMRRHHSTDTLGFNIRGGKEHFCGIFISRVLMNSDAHQLGLVEADQILAVNNFDFTNIGHDEAVAVLKNSLQLRLIVRHFPYGYKKTFDFIQDELPPSEFRDVPDEVKEEKKDKKSKKEKKEKEKKEKKDKDKSDKK